MKKNVITALFMLISTLTFAQNIEGTWTATIDTENGLFTFYADFDIDDEGKLTGRLYSDPGSVYIYETKIDGDKFEYSFDIDYNKLKHKGKMVDGKLEIKMISENNESDFTMSRIEKK